MSLRSPSTEALSVLLLALGLAGCDSYVERLADDRTITNIRPMPRGYVMYDIEGGTVTCKEHKSRSELSCWKK